MSNKFILFVIGVIAISVTHTAHALEPEFRNEVVYEFDKAVFGLTIGDLNEQAVSKVVCQNASGHIFLHTPDEWNPETISDRDDSIPAMWGRPTLSIGDVDPRYEENEIVALGETIVQSIYRKNNQWMSEVVFDLEGYVGSLWGARTGDYQPHRPGDEIFLIWEGVFDFSNGYVHSVEDDGWQQVHVYGEEVGMDSTVGEFDASNPSPEIVIPTEMGYTYQINPATPELDAMWPIHTIWDDFDNSGWVVKIADVLPEREGNEIIYGTRYTNRISLSYPSRENQHHMEIIFEGMNRNDPRNMWDIAVGDVLDTIDGNEIVGVDDSGRVYLLWRENNSWQSQVIWEEFKQSLYAVIIGEMKADHPGNEILVAGSSGKLTLLYAESNTSVSDWMYLE